MGVNKRKVRGEQKTSVVAERARSVALLWGVKERPSRGPRPGLSVEAIARAAIAVADAEGLPAVSMQRVAGEFGFTTMSLYRYVPGKSELLDLMIDTAIGEPPPPAPGGWRPGLEAWARALWQVFQRHPWALGATGSLRVMGPNELAWMDAALAAFAGTGLSGAEIHRAFLVVLGHVRSAAQFSVDAGRGSRSVDARQWAAATGELLRGRGDRYPALTAALASDAFTSPRDDGLEFGLRCVLDGVGVLVAQRARDLPSMSF